jgi:hypothetical protein
MAGSGGWLGRAWEKGEGDFYRPGSMPRRLLGSVVAYEAKEWARGGGDVRRDRRPMAEGSARGGESAVAAWHRPKPPRVRHTLAHSGGGAGLGPEVTLAPWRARATGLQRADVVRGVRHRAGTRALAPHPFRLALFKMKFLQISKQKWSKL